MYRGDHKLLLLLEQDNSKLDSIKYIPLKEIDKFKRLFFKLHNILYPAILIN